MEDLTHARPLTVGRGSRNEATRRHNLSTLLSLIHHHRGVSRADLTRATGLNRSTIGQLVAELVEAGLAEESAPVAGSVGRPSPMIEPASDVVAIAVNPDVDAIVIGVVGLGGTVHERIRVELEGIPTVEDMVRLVAARAAELLDASPWRAVGAGVALPGLVQVRTGAVSRAPHLLWREEPVAEPLSAALGVPVAVDNDANAGLIAETLFGAGRGRSDLVYLNGSASGIGGGVLVGGSVLRGADGFAGELGHTLVSANGEVCHCGRIGCLETEVNLQRLERAAGPDGIDHDHIEASLARDDSPALAAEIDRQVDTLARAMASFVSVFNPQAIVLGGFLGALQALRPEQMRRTLTELAFSPLADDLLIDRAELRDELLMVGAAEIAFASLLADPLGAG